MNIKKEPNRFSIPRWLAFPLFILCSPLYFLVLPLRTLYGISIVSGARLMNGLNLPHDSPLPTSLMTLTAYLWAIPLGVLITILYSPLVYLEPFAFPAIKPTATRGNTNWGTQEKWGTNENHLVYPIVMSLMVGFILIFWGGKPAFNQDGVGSPHSVSSIATDFNRGPLVGGVQLDVNTLLLPSGPTPKPLSNRSEFHIGQLAILSSYQLNQSLAQLDPTRPFEVQLMWDPLDWSEASIVTALSYESTDYHVFVELHDDQNQIMARSDHQPRSQNGTVYPTSQWRVGYRIPDYHRLSLPSSLDPTAEYTLIVGLYNEATGERLSALESDFVPIRP